MKQKQYDCIIIGGGAAGMMAAAKASEQNLRTALIEHTARLGSKLLQTGNGKCNFTNLFINEQCYQNEDKNFVTTVLKQFTVQDTLDFFESIGVYHKDRNGYVYPHSETAASLQDALRYEVEHKVTNVYLETQIEEIECDRNGLYRIQTDKGLIYAPAILLATGSKAAPRTGSDGSGYQIAKVFDHHIRKPLPALVQLVSKDKSCKVMSGVRSTGKIELYIDDQMITSDTGEIQYTDYGISGIPVFQISRFAVEAIDRKRNTYAVIDLLPDMDEDVLIQSSQNRLKENGEKTIEQYFSGLINKKLIQGICKRMNLNPSDLIQTVQKKQLLTLCGQLKHFKITLDDFKSFEQAQICQGGVSLKEINAKDMQSQLHKGLFFAGEIVDVDGKCGGYNLQWAWSSAAVAAKGIGNYVRKDK